MAALNQRRPCSGRRQFHSIPMRRR